MTPPEQGLLPIDAVLPVAVHDYRRAQMCLRSLARFSCGFGTVWLVHPDGDEGLLGALPLTFPFVRLLRESDVIPGGARASAVHRVAGVARPGCISWYRQQMIKLAIAYTFLAGNGRLDPLHQPVSFARWFGPCAWRRWLPGDPSWTPEAAFSDRSDGWFSLVSSRANMPIETLESMLAPYLAN